MSDLTPRVLVVDDERFYREAVTETLALAGISCVVAEDGVSAIAAAEQGEFGAVVLDIGLSEPCGDEVLRRLLELQPTIRVIVLATQSEHEHVLEALRLGACDYLAKPLHDEELGLAVNRALAGYAVESRLEELRSRVGVLDVRGAELIERAAGFESEERSDALGEDIVEIVSIVLGAAKASMMLLEADEGALRVVAAAGLANAPDAMDPIVPGDGVAGRAFAENTPFLVEDFETDERFGRRHPAEGDGGGSLIVTPICGPDGPIGVLCASEREGGGSFGAQDLALLRLFARQIGTLLVGRGSGPERDVAGQAANDSIGSGTRVEFTGDEPEFPDDAELSRAICEVITTELEPERLIHSVLGVVSSLLPAAPVALHLIENKSGVLVLEGQVEGAGPSDRSGLQRSGGLTGMVVQTGNLVATGYPEKDPRFDEEIDTPADGSVRPLICVPIKIRGKILGVLRAFPGDPAWARARTAEVLTAAVSAAVRNVLLYRSLLDSIDEVARVRRTTRKRK